MRKWRIVAAVVIVAVGLGVPVAFAMTNDGQDLVALPYPERGRGPDRTMPAEAVVKLVEGASTAAITSRGARVLGDIPGTGYVRVRPSGDVGDLITALRGDSRVAEAAPDFARHTARTPTDPYYGAYQQPYLTTVRMPEAWDRVSNAGNQVVAVIDTGVDASHPDLAGRVLPGYNAVAPGASTGDTEGHGTFVAGVIAANPSNGAGVAGVAWGAGILPVQVFSGDVAYDSDIAEGIYWAVDHAASVINLSLGGPGFSPLLNEAIQYALTRNVVVVAAAGNDGDDVAQYPAAFPGVVAVGATDGAGKLADFSSHGDWVDLAAPGVDITSTYPGGYAIGDGTSFSSPIVAGVAALVRTQNPQLSAADVADRLRATARDAGPRGIDPYYGYGVLDAAHAVGASYAADFAMPALGAGEPNDVPDAATPMTGSASGSLAIEGDVDWYRFDVNGSQTITVTVHAPPATGAQSLDPVIEVLSEDLQRLAIQNQTGRGADESVTMPVPPGHYLLRVSNFNGSAVSTPFTVTVSSVATSMLAPYIAYPVGSWPYKVVIGDVTGDGRNDVILETNSYFDPENDHKIFVFEQLPYGSLAAPVRYAPFAGVLGDMAILDVDQDGRNDIVVATFSGLAVLRQTADGLLTPQGLLPGVSGAVGSIATADIDDDGDTDVVLRLGTGVSLLTHGTGSSFALSQLFPDSVGLLKLGDLDNDGTIDIATVSGSKLVVFRHMGGSWIREEHESIRRYWPNLGGLDVADVTGDGLADAIVSVPGNLELINVFVQGAGGALTPVAYPAGEIPNPVGAADIDGDGLTDVVTVNSSWRAVSILLQQSDHTLAPLVQFAVPDAGDSASQGLALGDIDSDGLTDIVAASYSSGLVVLRHSSAVGGPRDLVTSVTPAAHATGAAPGASPRVVFSPAVDASTVDGGTVRLVDGRTGADVPATVSFDAGTHTATIDPVGSLDGTKPYRVVVEGVVDQDGELPLHPFSSTFVTASAGSLPQLSGLSMRGIAGTTVRVDQLTVPTGNLAEVIIRAAAGTTPPATPTAGTLGYSGVDPSPLMVGFTPGTSYAFSLWYRDRSGALSPRATAVLLGSTVTMSLTSGTTTVTTTDTLRFGTAVTIEGAATPDKQVTLAALCRGGAPTWQPVATMLTWGPPAGAGAFVDITQTRPDCAYRWEFEADSYMGAISQVVHVTSTIAQPGDTPRERD